MLLRRASTRETIKNYIWILPSVVFLLVVVAYPFSRAIYYSFYDLNMSNVSNYGSYVGIKNYINAFCDAVFGKSVLNLLMIVVSAVSLQLVLGFLIALFFHNNNFKHQRIFLTILIIPTMLAPIVVGLVWRFLLYTQTGLISYIFNKIGLFRDTSILSIRALAVITIIIVDTWEWTPFIALLFISGLTALPYEPFEAATIDGASKFQIVRYITIPLLKSVIMVALGFRFVDALKLFDIVFVLTNGGPAGATEVTSLYMYRLGFVYFNFSYSSTLAVFFIFAVIVITIIIYFNFKMKNKLFHKKTNL